MGQAKKEIPRWRRRQTAAPGPVVVLRGRSAKAYAAQQAAARTASGASTPATPAAGVLARTGAYRFRHHLVPVWLVLAILGTGLGAHAAHAMPAGILLGTVAGTALWFFTRHLSAFARKAGMAMAALTALWVPLLSLTGAVHPLLVLLFACWLALLVPWAKHYRWRPGTEEAPKAQPGDMVIWDRLAAKNNWHGHLADPEDIAGGRRYRIILDGAETHVGQVMGEPRKIAAAWGKPITEAYAEPTPDGIESTGFLTILHSNTLAKVREWDGKGIDPQTGMAVIGQFSDGQPMHAQWYAHRDGTSHFLVAGTTGSGKSELLNLLLCIAAVSGNIIPIVLDPQEGQSLPAWRKHVRFAAGVSECMRMLRALHALMSVRSQLLAVTPWTDDEGEEHDGMGSFDAELSGLPVIQVFIEEAPVLLKSASYGPAAVMLISDLTKRGRKAGISVVLVAQVPSLAELGGDQALRDMLAGGNAISLRTANKVSAAMIGMTADPSSLPKYFTAKQDEALVKTYGLGYAVGPDNRLAPARMMLERHPGRYARKAVWPGDHMLDAAIAEAAKPAGRPAAPAQAPVPVSAALAVVPPSEDDKPGRTAADAVLAVLGDAGAELTKGEIVVRCKALVTQAWQPPRAEGFRARGIGDVLSKLVASEQIDKTGHGSYATRKPSLHSVPQTAAASNGATAR